MSSTKKNGGMTPRALRAMIIMAMLIAMTVVLDRTPGLSIKTPGWKIGFSFIPPMIAAMLLGPIESAIVYGLSDLIGALLFPFGPYHPGFTAVAALMGFIMGLFLNKRPLAFARSEREWSGIRFFPNMLLPVAINCLLLGLVVNTVWVAQLYGSKTYAGWFTYRLAEYAILVPVQLVLIPALLKLCDLIKRSGSLKLDRRGSEARLKEISRNESILGLERVTELLSLMGDPQDRTPVVHVAGTNGKGSFTAMLASVLKAAGLKVGTFTSPAITGVTDPFRIDGERIDDAQLDSLLERIEPLSASMEEKPTEFEVMTAAAYQLFADEQCDIAVVECGLGGAGDSTNVVSSPLLSVITNVELDHTGRLGSTTAKIAVHKAGIIKSGCPVLFGGTDPDADEVIARTAAEKRAPLTRTDHSRLGFVRCGLDGTDMEFSGFGSLHLSLLGEYQPKNAANVLTAVELLRESGLDIPDDAVREGLANAYWPARFELLRRDPIVVFDGSHNPDGIGLAAKSIGSCLPGGRAAALMSVMADKDYESYPALLRGSVVRVFAVRPALDRALDADRLKAVFERGGIPAESFDSFDDGVRAAYAYAKENGVPLVAMGTLYMYKEFLEALETVG
ncbi:MAG: folate family ECF transporter S component [Clostridia bacterium]|nr:folate family ECF transporter S component [Clostridia bacterium]